ncbi:MAG: RsmE family RNA methyltransferase [Lachnospiraceae bacterium]|nr:RsmE family RNA methyltransferase [Lachnospiraceae bacterium]
MQQIFVREEDIEDGRIRVTGEDANHLGRAIRLKVGEKIRVSTDAERNFICEAVSFDSDALTLQILEESEDTEPANRIILFQAIPKGSRMETVIEKAVELGASEIIPVDMKYCVVRLDEKKKESRVQRWQKIADGAARQSKRSQMPKVGPVLSFREAADRLLSLDISLVPYENAQGAAYTMELLRKIKPGQSVGILIGPEGGFAPEEIDYVRDSKKAEVISLGHRILRTDTAAIASMTLVMMASEEAVGV